MADSDAFQEGYDAYWDGVDLDDSPYVLGTEHSFRWDEGWSHAQVEDKGEVKGENPVQR